MKAAQDSSDNTRSDFTSFLSVRPFGTTETGNEALHFRLQNRAGMRVGLTNFGGIVTHIEVPDRNGALADVVLGFNDFVPYRKNPAYFGATIGRFANRIGGGRFSLNGKTYELATNEVLNGRPCVLHGGSSGWDKAIWKSLATIENDVPTVRLQHYSPDGDEGFPGAVDATVTYRLLPENSLEIVYTAISDQPTPLNLTNHSYFNLRGEGHPTVADHVVTLHADHMTPTDAGSIPTGKLRPIAGTAFDFREPHAIGERIDDPDEQLVLAGGYDHNFVLRKSAEGAFALAAEVYEPHSGRVMETWTTEPGVQFYGGNFLDGTLLGKSGKAYVRRSGFCLETQHFPDSPNRPEFPSTVLEPGTPFQSRTVYRFKTRA